MTDAQDSISRLRARLSRQGEEALGRVAEELARSPVVGAALSGALEAREKATQAQEAALGVLSIPSAADVERLTRRVRSVSQRLEAIEDTLDNLEARLDTLLRQVEERGSSDVIEARLDEIAKDLSALRDAAKAEQNRPARGQRRLSATEG